MMILSISRDSAVLDGNYITRPNRLSPSQWMEELEIFENAREYKKQLDDLRESLEFIKQEEYARGYADGCNESSNI